VEITESESNHETKQTMSETDPTAMQTMQQETQKQVETQEACVLRVILSAVEESLRRSFVPCRLRSCRTGDSSHSLRM